MKNQRMNDSLRQEIRRVRIEPASDEFYEGVWRRIRTASRQAAHPQILVLLGKACWRSLPVCALVLLLLFVYNAMHPVEVHPALIGTAESYVVDESPDLSEGALLFQVTHVALVPAPEKLP